MKRKLLIIGMVIAVAVAVAWHYTSNPWRASRIGEIPAPLGFKRVEADGYGVFLRSLPLKRHGSMVRLYTGGKARLQFLSLGVIDMPLLSNSEQCADITMRIRAEYLWDSGEYARIGFKDVNGNRHPYNGGSSRDSFEKYLKATYDRSNTASVYKETQARPFGEVQPGDVFVYPSRRKGAYGHAVLVADVAKNRSGRIAVLCVEGNTPAREAHVLRNLKRPWSAWFVLNGDEDVAHLTPFKFNKGELRHY
jgi:hypothetical protein